MSLTIEADVLAKALARVKGAAGRTMKVDVLATCLVSASDGVMSLAATNLDLYAEVTAPCDGDLAPVCIPIWLLETAADLKGRDLSIACDGRTATVVGGRSRFNAQVLPASDFPKPTATFDGRVEVSGVELSRALAFCAPAVSSEQARFYLCGVSIAVEGEGVVCAATDGHRLHATPLNAASSDIRHPMIVPAAAVSLLSAMADAAGDDIVSMETGELSIAASHGGLRLVSRLIDGAFPDWRRVVPPESPDAMRVDRAEMVSALQRMERALVKSASKEGNRIVLDVDGECLHVFSPEMAEDRVAAEFSGDVPIFACNARYLRECADSLTGAETISLHVGVPGRDGGRIIRVIDARRPTDIVQCVSMLVPPSVAFSRQADREAA